VHPLPRIFGFIDSRLIHEATPMPEKIFPDQRTDRADTAIRVCDKCSANMSLLSDLPSFHDYAAAKIFRCYACNNVARSAV
jgi:hypothetical protein